MKNEHRTRKEKGSLGARGPGIGLMIAALALVVIPTVVLAQGDGGANRLPNGVVVSEPVAPADNAGLPLAPTVDPGKDTPPRIMHPPLPMPKASRTPGAKAPDPVIQETEGTGEMPIPIVNVEGTKNVDNVLPPDTNGEVGPNHYVQMVNVSTAVYQKNGTLQYGPFHPSALWPAGDICNANNDGDPVVLYDQLANRWLLSQFALPSFPTGPYYQCIAVSKGAVPTNNPADWHAYTFKVHDTKMNDYPKLAVWPDGYYMSANQFTNGANWGGAGVFVFDRAKMLSGQAASFQYIDVGSVSLDFGGMLPADLDGATPPPAESPAYFAEVDDASWIPPTDALRLWEFHVDWTNPANTFFGLAGQPNAVLPTAAFTLLPCVNLGTLCIPQPNTGQKLDGVADRLMFRLSYRNFGDHESLVVNHTVKADKRDRAGVRWYEVRDPGGNPAIYQQGTYAPNDGLYRWMGSAAMDGDGNLALGYSVSSTTVYPSIRYTGRLASDPLGQLPQAEESIIAGSGSQTHPKGRWGDYSDMTVDPTDDCTFWYTQEYIKDTGNSPWQTRIASFKFPECGGVPTTYRLTASKDGTGNGFVSSTPPGISCGPDCTEDYQSGTQVSLQAKALRGSVFAGWSGACTGTGQCDVIMDQDQSVTATFNKPSKP